MTVPPNNTRRALAALTTLAVTLSLSLHPASADSITLTNGTTMEGKLISQTDESVRFEIGKSVKQVRTFKRSEIANLVVIPKDEIALNGIKELLPTPDLLDAIAYRRLIDGAPKNFLAAFPNSTHRPEVEKIIATLEAERNKVTAGGQA